MFSKSYSKKPKLSKAARSKKSSRCKDNFVQMMELRKKILILRDIVDLPPLERSASINEVSFLEFLSFLILFSSCLMAKASRTMHLLLWMFLVFVWFVKDCFFSIMCLKYLDL